MSVTTAISCHLFKTTVVHLFYAEIQLVIDWYIAPFHSDFVIIRASHEIFDKQNGSLADSIWTKLVNNYQGCYQHM